MTDETPERRQVIDDLLAQVFCNALLMVAELDDYNLDHMSFRWFRAPGEAWFRGLQDPWREALLAGVAVRHAEAKALERDFWTTADAKGTWIEPPGGCDE